MSHHYYPYESPLPVLTVNQGGRGLKVVDVQLLNSIEGVDVVSAAVDVGLGVTARGGVGVR